METEVFQLDQYHLSKNVIRNVSDKKVRCHMMRWLKAGDIDKALKKINELKNECGENERELKKLETLEGYIKANIDGIVIYLSLIHI